MKQFFKMVLATMVGFILSYVLIILLVFGIMIAMVAAFTSKEESEIKSNSILTLKLDYEIPDRTHSNPFNDINWSSMRSNKHVGLNEIMSSLEKAAKDEKIKGIYLDLSVVQSGIATLEELRNGLLDFKKSGKFIYTYSETLSQGAYYLASVSDKIFLNPQGMIEFKGLHAEMMFFKHTFEKLELEPEVIRHGKFKSAVEPFVNEKMSPENREQMNTLLQSVWSHIKSEVSKERKVEESQLQQICDNFSVRSPEDAVAMHLIDSLVYYDGMMSLMKKKIGIKESDKINFVKLGQYVKAADPESPKKWSKNKVAVIYASGGIASGESDEDNIGSDSMAETIRKARLDSAIKAIVIRVNSPGGSALASEVIWKEVVLAKAVKPVVVSMGDVAASGGYYISCGASKIIAQPNTITGSIGVFGLFFNTQKLLNNKLGINVDTISTAHYADIMSQTRPMRADEKSIIQGWIERIYDVFTTRVSDGRGIAKAQVDSIGQGRVWIGSDALKLGLVDGLGGLNKAIDEAIALAKIKEYRIVEWPEQKDAIQELVDDLTENAKISVMEYVLQPEEIKYIQSARLIYTHQGIQARMPYAIDWY